MKSAETATLMPAGDLSIHSCPGCGSNDFVDGPALGNQPVMLNYRCKSRAEALKMGQGRLQLRECQNCGLIFNASFDTSLISYDSSYDNRQGFSPVFRSHLESVADQLMAHIPKNGRVLEVGCGKGEFLRLLRDRGCTRCVGYDTSCPDSPSPADHGIEYHCSYVTPADVKEPFDLVICRHVVEHVPEIGAFLKDLSNIAKAAGDALLVVETPEFGWIVENQCFWDYFYEHCNYFTYECLEKLARNSGLKVLDHKNVFGDQYQLIIARPAPEADASEKGIRPILTAFLETTREAQDRLEKAIAQSSGSGGWAIWGAGAKGVTLASRLQHPDLRFAIDANPEKSGCFLPGSAIPVISPGDPRIREVALVVIANPMYQSEVQAALGQIGFEGHTITVGS